MNMLCFVKHKFPQVSTEKEVYKDLPFVSQYVLNSNIFFPGYVKTISVKQHFACEFVGVFKTIRIVLFDKLFLCCKSGGKN